MVLRRLPLLLLIAVGCSDPSGGTCPDGSALFEGTCRLQCTTSDECLLSEICEAEVCRPAPDDFVEIRRFELAPSRVDASVPIEVRYAVLGAAFSELFVVRGGDEQRVARFVEPVGTYSFTDTTASGTLVLRASGEEARAPFVVDLEPRPVRIDAFASSKTTVPPGESFVLSWSTTGATGVRITANGETVFEEDIPIGDLEQVISQSTIFELTATDGEATDSASLTVTLEDDRALKITAFDVSHRSIVRGDSVSLMWRVEGARRIDIQADGQTIYTTLHPAFVEQGAWLSVPVADETAYRLLATSTDGSTELLSNTIAVESIRRPAAPRLSGVFVDPPHLAEAMRGGAIIRWDAVPNDTVVTIVDVATSNAMATNGNRHDVTVPMGVFSSASYIVRAENEGGVDEALVTIFRSVNEREPNDVADPSLVDASDSALFGSIDPSLVDVDRFDVPLESDGFIRITQRPPCAVSVRLELRRESALVDSDASTPQRCASLFVTPAAAGLYTLRVSDALTGGQEPTRPYELWVETVELPICGNDALESGEGCDDGNRANFDGCSGACTLEPTHQYVSTELPTPQVPQGTPLVFQGIRAGSASDDGYAVVPLPFEFPYFANRYAAVVVHTNGYIGLLPDFLGRANSELSAPFGEAAPNAILGPFAADLGLERGPATSIRVATPGGGSDGGFVVRFDDLRFANGATSLSGGVGLYPDGRFTLFYGPLVTPAGRSVQAGAEDARGHNRVQVPGCGANCTTGALPANRMFEFKPGIDGN